VLTKTWHSGTDLRHTNNSGVLHHPRTLIFALRDHGEAENVGDEEREDEEEI